MPKATPPFRRLIEGYTELEGGCWDWNGNTTISGYGVIKVFGKMVSAHRYSYELHNGPIQTGMHILHSCDRKTCINPDHLRSGSHAENMREAAERGRMRSGENHPLFGTRPKRPRQAKPVVVLGKLYESQNDAERQLGLGSGTVAYWIKHIPSKARRAERG